MRILITGAKGFIGRNLVLELQNRHYENLLLYDVDNSQDQLEEYVESCDFIFHLAGVNRPQDTKEYMEGNRDFTKHLLMLLARHNNKATIVMTSSIQAALDNPYGVSKLAGEEAVFSYGNALGTNIYIFRLPNVYGKWCRPNYNSVVATFCYNIAHDIPIQIIDEKKLINLVYVEDVVKSLVGVLEQEQPSKKGKYCSVNEVDSTTVGNLAHIIKSFRMERNNLCVANMKERFIKSLYSTYMSYLPENSFNYPLTSHIDSRGSFTEILKQDYYGQISVNVINTGITKGNHWHHHKVEKFIILSGEASVKFRKVSAYERNEIIEYCVSGKNLEVIDIPPGYVHNITNTGSTELVVLMWINEPFNPESPDTYFLEV